MIGLILALAAFCVILLLILGNQDDKNASLAAENGLLRGRLEALQNNGVNGDYASTSMHAQLSISDIEEAIRFAGHIPDTRNQSVGFVVGEDSFLIETANLPLFFISRYYTVQTSEWDMSLLKEAAHMMSDDLVIVKALIDECPERTTLRFCVAAMDRNYYSLRDNLIHYINILAEANRRLIELYDQLQEEKKESEITANIISPEIQSDTRLLS